MTDLKNETPEDQRSEDELRQEENEQIAQRKAKLAEWRKQGQAYPNDFKRDALAAVLHEHYDGHEKDVLEAEPVKVKIAGRMMTRRVMGKASFSHVQDMSGQMQVYLMRDRLPEGVYQNFKTWDLGDIIGVEGELFKTKTGELTVKADSIQLLTKALRPLPDKFHGLSDIEQRYRQRYLDLITNEESRNVFHIRSKVIAGLRNYLDSHGFVEVETPMMHSQPGGATARPFVTHHNALDMELYLRVAPELYLKRLVVGGIEKVYEINRNFRNEGISTRHNPEFTMLEFYMAYADFEDMMDYSEEMLRQLAQNVLQSTTMSFQGNTIDFGKPFARIPLKQSILQLNPEIAVNDLEDFDRAKELAKQHNIPLNSSMGLGKIQMELFEKLVEKQLIQPTFITEFPTEVSPLARANNDDPTITDRFELYVGGQEVANGFSELNDPEDQAERFKGQIKAKEAGDNEAMSFDEDYIMALEHGLPPTAGEGIGIDRLVMLFSGCSSIRDVILFPLLRKK